MLPLLFLFIFGLIELGRLYWVRSSIQLAITEAGRYVMIHTSASNSTLTDIVNDSLYALDSQDFSLSFTTEINNSITYKVVSASYNYTFITASLLDLDPLTMSFTSKVPLLP